MWTGQLSQPVRLSTLCREGEYGVQKCLLHRGNDSNHDLFTKINICATVFSLFFNKAPALLNTARGAMHLKERRIWPILPQVQSVSLFTIQAISDPCRKSSR